MNNIEDQARCWRMLCELAGIGEMELRSGPRSRADKSSLDLARDGDGPTEGALRYIVREMYRDRLPVLRCVHTGWAREESPRTAPEDTDES